jgi:energy-coupling factor transport system ATP-binding protein
MESAGMNLQLDAVIVQRDPFELAAKGTFCEGLHLVSGPVGSGKSTLALVMAGLLAPHEGTIDREDVTSCMLSLQFPEYHLTGQTLAEECLSWGLDPDPLLSAEGFGKKHGENPLKLSRGELKRFHLACVLAKRYDLLLLDEPFSALDCCQKEILCQRLPRSGGGITIIFTHEQEILPPIDRCWAIRGGMLADLGTSCQQPDLIIPPKEYREKPGDPEDE